MAAWAVVFNSIIIYKDLTLFYRYKTPEEFEPSKLTVSKSDVCQEDLIGKELWLIRAPVDVITVKQ
jgi:hypothetical protein